MAIHEMHSSIQEVYVIECLEINPLWLWLLERLYAVLQKSVCNSSSECLISFIII